MSKQRSSIDQREIYIFEQDVEHVSCDCVTHRYSLDDLMQGVAFM
jgi:hypothetical protein